MIEILIVAVLANYAISRTVTREDGPYLVFSRLRKWLNRGKPTPPTDPAIGTDEAWNSYNAEFDNYENYLHWYNRSFVGFVGGLFNCAYCLSYYSAALLVVYVVIPTGIYWYIPLVYLATVGGTHLLLKYEDK